MAVVFTVIFISAGKGQEVVKSKSENESGQEVQEEEAPDEKGKERGLEFELALLYFLKLQDYEESIRILHQMKGELAAENLEVIVKVSVAEWFRNRNFGKRFVNLKGTGRE